MKTLAELVKVLLHKEVRGPVDIAVSGLAYHSGQVKPGDVFFCLPGARSHGKRYLAEAEAAGAVAVITDLPEVETSVTLVRVPETRMALALLSAHFYDYPSRELVLTGVTGTNGKTTVTHLIDALLASNGAATGLIGTVRYHIGGVEYPSLATTPEANELQALLRQMRAAGVTYATMEVSSHALALQRTIGCDFDTVVMTNVTEDHLDFHQTFEHYLRSKIKLFSSLGSFPVKEGRFRRAVINGDDVHWAQFAEQTPAEVLLYGLSPRCQIRASEVQVLREGVSFRLATPVGGTAIKLKMTGLFSVYNALAATAVAYAEGLPLAQIKAVLEGVSGIPGRFELVDAGQNYTVIVDYAHTPDGLGNVLRAVREFAPARVLTVFGCGGDRDRTKRPLMGEEAGKYSDYCVVTSDNPRTEEPGAIIAEILPGLQRTIGAGGFEIQPDRREAIARALELAQAEDIVVIAGKGHETSQIFAEQTIPFDDRQIARELIQRRGEAYGDDAKGNLCGS